MRFSVLLVAAALLAVLAGNTFAADRKLADALAAAGAANAAKGNVAKAKDTLYKALAYDETCPDAIYELAKIFEKEGNAVEAGDFYQRAALVYSQEGKTTSDPKRSDAEHKVKALNPYAAKLSAYYEDYAQDLEKTVRKNTDALTQETAVDRVKELNLAAVLPAEKIPLFYKDALTVAAKVEKPAPKPKPSGSSNGFPNGFSHNTATRGTTAPDVERELKKLGWDEVKGQWVKKGPNTYEGTNARLEAKKMIGGIDVVVWKGYSSAVIVAVRDESTDTEYLDSGSIGMSSSSRFSNWHSVNGYGVLLQKDCKVYAPGGWSGVFFSSNGKYEPYLYNSFPMAEAPKYHVTVTQTDPTFDAFLNDKKLLHFNDKNTPARGQFVLEIEGTGIIEMPRAAGK